MPKSHRPTFAKALFALAKDDLLEKQANRLLKIVAQVPESHRPTFAEALYNLTKYNLLQPDLARASGKGTEVRSQEWGRIAGRKTGSWPTLYVAGGLALGVLGGFIMSTQWWMWLSFAICVPVGLAFAVWLSRVGSYEESMMRVVVNERFSRITPAKATAQAEAWVPKALLAWRSHEWRYRNGQPYLWTMLPHSTRIHAELISTIDYLDWPADPYRAKDVAVYEQRSINRMLSENAAQYAAVDADVGDDDRHLLQKHPWLGPVALMGGGLLIPVLSN